jgi:hypothetical protein
MFSHYILNTQSPQVMKMFLQSMVTASKPDDRPVVICFEQFNQYCIPQSLYVGRIDLFKTPRLMSGIGRYVRTACHTVQEYFWMKEPHALECK